MSYKKCFSLLLLTCAALLAGAGEARACSCAAKPTVLDAFELADLVVITRVVSVERVVQKAVTPGHKSNEEKTLSWVKSTRMVIERVFKGGVKAGDEIALAQGGGADCVWTFSEKNIGEQFLFYLDSTEKNPALWYGSGCGRSGLLNQVADDLLYLKRLAKVRGKSRISGTLRAEDGQPRVEGRRIRITGAGKTYEVKTDANGVYEIYDLPAARYLIEPEMPPGWKVNDYYLRYSSSYDGDREDPAPKKIPIVLEDRKHALLDIHFEIDNALRGRVYDPEGRLMNDVCVALVPAHGPMPSYSLTNDCTEDGGAFEITEIPAGSYVLVVNQDGAITSRAPFRMFYYPDVSERERAMVITIGAGDTLEGFDIRVPRMRETVMVEGVFLYADDKPVAEASVKFKAVKAGDYTDGDAQTTTDANGRFSLKILKGLEGELQAALYVYADEYEKCPQIEELVQKGSGRTAEVSSPVVKFRVDEDLPNVELKLSIPACKKAKATQ